MGRFFDLTLLLFSFQSVFVFGQAPPEVDEELDNPSQTPVLNVKVDASFLDAEIFGIKLVNGKPTNVKLSFSNEEPEPISVQFVGGSLWTPDFDPSGTRLVRNLTTKQYVVEIPAGEQQSVTYDFQTNMHPQELRLNIAAVLSKGSTFFTQQAFNGTVTVVEPDTSIFDPQIIFLYFFLLACAGGVGYLFYNIWIVPYFPQKKKSGKTPRTPAKKVELAADKADQDTPATATGSKAYAEEWIPSHHLQRPEAKRVKSGSRPRSRQG